MYDPDASSHFQCQLDEAAQIDSHSRESLSIVSDNESNVLTSRNLRIAANTNCLIGMSSFKLILVCWVFEVPANIYLARLC